MSTTFKARPPYPAGYRNQFPYTPKTGYNNRRNYTIDVRYIPGGNRTIATTFVRDDIDTWHEHIRVLAGDIGPRGSTTAGERRAAEYSAEQLSSLSYQPKTETFISARSPYQLHMMAGLLVIIAFATYPGGGRVTAVLAALITLLAVYSQTREMLFMDNPLRRLMSKGPSQNVFATLPPEGEHLSDLVLIGHLDSHHSALIFSSMKWVDAWRIYAPTAYFSFILQLLLYILGAITTWAWIWPASIFSAVCGFIMVAVCLEGEFAPYSPGANDNASGAALVLTLAKTLRDRPLKHTRVWLVLTGCEEVKHYGAIDFFERHQHELHNPAVLVFEMMGIDGPAMVSKERIVPPFNFNSDPDMMARAQQLLAQRPDLHAHPTIVNGAHTEMADALRLGIPAMTLVGVGPEGVPFGYDGPELYWHRKDDTPTR